MICLRTRRSTGRRIRARVRPGLEALERRVALSTFFVNTLSDTVAVNLKTGRDAAGHISLRSAIMAANAHPSSDTIILPAGTFTLTIPGRDENNDATGDLDIRSNLTIKGKGAASTIIDGNKLDRVFHIFSGKVTLSGLTIQHGLAFNENGGGILISGGSVTLRSVTLSDNEAVGISGSDGGKGNSHGVFNSMGSPGQNGATVEGGGIFLAGGALSISSSVISGNEAIGGIGGTGGAGVVATDSANFGGASHLHFGGDGGAGGDGGDALGGGIYSAGGALSITNSTIMSNEAIAGIGGSGGAGAGFFALQAPAGKNGVPVRGGKGGAGGDGGEAMGGGVYNGEFVRLKISGTTFSFNSAESGSGGAGAAGGKTVGGFGGAFADGAAGSGGNANGGAGGSGGTSGNSSGGGLFNDSHGVTLFSGAPSTFIANTALASVGGAGGFGGGASGGNGGSGASAGTNGGEGGIGDAGNAGAGGNSGNSSGGGIFNNGSCVSTVALTFTSNLTQSRQGGIGGTDGAAYGGNGGAGSAGNGSDIADGGSAQNGTAGAGGAGGSAFGAGVCNAGAFVIKAPKNGSAVITSSFTHNEAVGGPGGAGGGAGNAEGGDGELSSGTNDGAGGLAVGGPGGSGGQGGSAFGGGLCNFSDATVSFTGVTVTFSLNAVGGGGGGSGEMGGHALGGNGSSPTSGGDGGIAVGGNGGNGGAGGSGFGGGIASDGSLTIAPRQGVKKRSKQASATSSITENNAMASSGGQAGAGGIGTAGTPDGPNVNQSNGNAGKDGALGTGIGGGLAVGGNTTDPNTTITGNHADTSDDNVDSSFSFPP